MKYTNLSTYSSEYKYTKFYKAIGELEEKFTDNSICLLALNIHFDCYSCGFSLTSTKHPVIYLIDDCENMCKIELSEFDYSEYRVWAVSNDHHNKINIAICKLSTLGE